MIKIGCCGWAEAQKKYSRDFSVIEIQETFYQPGNISKYGKWRGEAPDDFDFIVKAWQLITHDPSSPTYRKLKEPVPRTKQKHYGSFRPTDEVFAAWGVVDEVAQALNSPIILFQCPSSFGPVGENKENLRTFFRKINRRNYTLVWEPRGSWEGEEIKGLCRELDLVHCVDPFKTRPVYGTMNYFRLHGKPGYNLRYAYTDEDLRELARMADKKSTYVLFNNLSMLKDARRFARIIDTDRH
jgi:uncharacterized protein YecE (DUF72 family)